MASQRENGNESTPRWAFADRFDLTRTPDLFANTSLDDPFRPTTADIAEALRRRRRRRRLQQNRRERAARQREREEETVERMHMLRRAAARATEKAWSDLNEHRSKQAILDRQFAKQLHALHRSHPRAFHEFKEHLSNASKVTPSDIRRYDIASWFKKLPAALRTTIVDLRRYHLQLAQLQVRLRDFEIKEWGQRPQYQFYEDDLYAMDQQRAGNGDGEGVFLADQKTFLPAQEHRRFGYEEPGKRQGFEECDLAPRELDYVRMLANFKVRKIRLLHAPRHVRFLKPSQWDESLDFSMCKFMGATISRLIFSEPAVAEKVLWNSNLQVPLDALSKMSLTSDNDAFCDLVCSMADLFRALTNRRALILRLHQEIDIRKKELDVSNWFWTGTTVERDGDAVVAEVESERQEAMSEIAAAEARLQKARLDTMPLASRSQRSEEAHEDDFQATSQTQED